MMNRTVSNVRPFLCQFEVAIPQEGEENEFVCSSVQIFSVDYLTSANPNISKALGTTKITRVKDETTDDE